MTEVAEVKRQFVERLKKDFPELRFVVGRKFMFRPARTVVYEKIAENAGTGNSMENVRRDEQNYDTKTSSEQVKCLPEDKICQTAEESEFFCLRMLHEVGHAVLKHQFYATDVGRLKMERAAWEKAREFCRRYGVVYDEEFVEAALDSYRDWLHQRSKCPKCGVTKFQDGRGKYHCPDCDSYGVSD